MKIFFSIVFVFLDLIGFGQLTYQKPDSNRIIRANSQVEVASLLVDVNVDFFENSSSIIVDGKVAQELVLQVVDANQINVYFDSLKLSNNNTLEVYNELGGLELTINSHSNPNGGPYAIAPITGSQLKFVFRGVIKESLILIGELGYFWKKSVGISNSGFCEVDVNCSEGKEWENQKNGVVRLQLKRNDGSTVYCSGSLINNTSRDCKPYILSAAHCLEKVSLNNLKQSHAYFNYENSGCDSKDSDASNFLLGMTFRASTSYDNGSDVLLLELNQSIPLEYNPFFNGWNNSEGLFYRGTSIHHPKGDVKKISTYSNNLVTANDINLNDDAFWEVNWEETSNGHGVTESGSSGAPIFNYEKLIVGVLSVGTSYCSRPEDPDYYGKISYSWDNQLDSSKRLDVWLDPTQTLEGTLTGSYFPCNDTTERYVPIDSITVKLNPVHEGISLYVEQSISNSVKVYLYDCFGKIIKKVDEPPSNISEIEIRTNSMRDGMYFLLVKAGNEERVFKIIVVN